MQEKKTSLSLWMKNIFLYWRILSMKSEQIDSIELKSNETTDKYINKKKKQRSLIWISEWQERESEPVNWVERLQLLLLPYCQPTSLILLLLLLLWYANLFRWSNTVLHSASAIRDSISENSLVWSIDDKHQCFVFLVYSFSLLLLLLRDLPMLPMALTLTANEKKKKATTKKKWKFPFVVSI